jgi:hypothetical protein
MQPAPLTLQSLPLFPLNTVLFPGGVLPLQVFEVRYLNMIATCHRTGAPFGVVALSSGHEVRTPTGPQEQLHTMGTLARITQMERPQPGLLMVQCGGEQRFHIDTLSRLPHGLWVADVSLLPSDDTIAIPADLRHAAESLRRVHAQLRTRTPQSNLPTDDDAAYNDCAWVANRWCELLPLPLSTRQQLMALGNPLVRLELVADLLERQQITPDH